MGIWAFALLSVLAASLVLAQALSSGHEPFGGDVARLEARREVRAANANDTVVTSGALLRAQVGVDVSNVYSLPQQPPAVHAAEVMVSGTRP